MSSQTQSSENKEETNNTKKSYLQQQTDFTNINNQKYQNQISFNYPIMSAHLVSQQDNHIQSESDFSTLKNSDKSIPISIVCEDRLTNKKCLFPISTDNFMNKTTSIYSLLNSSLSAKLFLKGHLIFYEQDGMDISLGLFPFEMDTKFEVQLNQTNNIVKINHQLASPTSYNMIPQIQPTLNFSHTSINDNSDTFAKIPLSDLSAVSKLNSSNLLSYENKQGKQQEIKNNFVGQSLNNQSNSSDYQSHSSLRDESFQFDEEEDEEILEKKQNKMNLPKQNLSINQINKDISYSIKDENCEVNIDIQKKKIENEEDDNHSNSSKNSSILKKGIKKEKSKTISKQMLSQTFQQRGKQDQSEEQELSQSHSETNNVKKRRRQTLNKRSHERTIREGILLVTKWRNFHEYHKSNNQVKDLQEVANDMKISKKTLDYYFLELRTAEFFNFDFDQNLDQRMGFLRQFIEEQTKIFQENNKQTKIPRQLNFKYKLPELQQNIIPQSYQQQNYLSLLQNPYSQVNEDFHPQITSQNNQIIQQQANISYQQNAAAQYNQSQLSTLLPQQMQQQKINYLKINQSIKGSQITNENQFIDGNSTSSHMTSYNYSQQVEGSLSNQQDLSFLNQQVNLKEEVIPQQQQSQQLSSLRQPNSYPTHIQMGGNDLNIQQQFKLDHIVHQIQDDQNNGSIQHIINRDNQNYQNYQVENISVMQSIELKQNQLYPSNISQDQVLSAPSQQIKKPLFNQQSLSSDQFVQQSNQQINSDSQILNSGQNNQTEISADILHPYSQKINNKYYQEFLEKQKLYKQQEIFENPTPYQRIFE